MGFIVFKGKADGSWEPRRELKMVYADTFDESSRLYKMMGLSFVTVADWDGDGVADVLWNHFRGISVATGPFNLNKPISLTHRLDFGTPLDSESGMYIADFAVADWDRDGKPDLLVRLVTRGKKEEIYWYKNLGSPGLTKLASRKRLVEFPDAHSATGFCIADWNGDGRPDLIVTRIKQLTAGGEKPRRFRESVWLHLRK